jgi:hypothetical protein
VPVAATKKPPFAAASLVPDKPSDGLEPSTPSLPWRLSAPAMRAGNSAHESAFPCNSVGFSASGTPSSKDPEPPRKASNLSPKPSPNETVLVGAICRN